MAKRLISFLLALCLIASFFVGTLPQAYAAEKSQGLGTVSLGKGMENETAPVYDKPNGKSFTSLKHGTQVSILKQVKDENGNQWYKIRYTPKVEGYMPKSQISFDNPNSTSTTAKVGFVNEKVTSNLRIRNKPSEKDFKTIELLYAGDKVTILSTETIDKIKWYKIRTEKGNEGWCKSEYITQGSSKKEPSSSNSPSSSKLKRETIGENGTIISWAQIYTSIDPKKVPHSKSFTGGEGVFLSELITDSKGNQYYYFEFGKLTGYIDKDNALRVSEEEFHGRPGSVDTSKKGTVNKLVTSHLMVRSSPSEKDFTVLDRLYCGEQVSIIQITTINKVKWYRILTEDNIEGWVKAQYIDDSSNKNQQNSSNSPSSSKLKRETIGENGTIISWAQIYTSITPNKVPHSKSFTGGEGVFLSELITDSKGNQYYYFEFGKLTGYIDKDNALRVSEEEFHGRPGSVDTSKKGTVNKLVTSHLMVRSSPSEKDFTVLDRLYCGEQVSIIQTTTINKVKWYRILTEDNIEGWVKAQYIDDSSNKNQQNNSTANSSARIPSTKGKSSYLAANSTSENVLSPSGDIVKSIKPGTIFRCYGKCDYDPNRVWIDLDDDEVIDGSIISGSVCRIDKKAIIVSITEQKLYVLRNYEIVFSAPCITGNKGTKDTNLGVQKFIELKPGTWMVGTRPNGTKYRTWTDFWMQFNTDEESIHNSTRRKPEDYTPHTYDGDGSYGCVNVTYDTAKTLYNKYAYLGEQVIVTMSTSKLFG